MNRMCNSRRGDDFQLCWYHGLQVADIHLNVAFEYLVENLGFTHESIPVAENDTDSPPKSCIHA